MPSLASANKRIATTLCVTNGGLLTWYCLQEINKNMSRIKRKILIILTLMLSISCSSNDKTISFAGSWICEDYFKNINEFKSPMKAQDGSMFIFISDTALKEAMMIYNFHEGAPQSLDSIQFLSPTKIKLAGKTFLKINPIQIEYGSYRILEEILFKGSYTNAEGKNVEFKNNGQVEGLDNFHFYSPSIDYFDAGMQVDQVQFGTSEKELSPFGFKFNKDTLELYKLNCLTFDSTDKRCVEVENGQLAYKLWRTK